MLAGAIGERPVALRRRLLLERAAWQLRTGAATPCGDPAGGRTAASREGSARRGGGATVVRTGRT